MNGIRRIKNNLLSYYGKKKMDSTPKLSTFILECPFAVKWEIEEERLAALKDSENGCLETQWFDASNIPGVQYYLKMYPNGDEEKDRGKVFIYLHLELGKEKKVKAEYKVSIESGVFIYKFNNEFVKIEGWGDDICQTNDLFDPEEKFIVNGKFSVKFEGTLKVERQSGYNKWKKGDIGGKLLKANDKDFVIVIDGKNIQAHKNLLAARSPVFEAMFNSGMIEATENKLEIIDFSYETVELALELCYNRRISSLTFQEKISILTFMDKYDIQDLKDLLQLSLIEDINVTSVVKIANYSITSNSLELQERCMDYMIASFRMNQLIDDFDDLNESFAVKVFKNIYYQVVKT